MAVSTPEARPPLIVICGATATGKTGLSLAIADALGHAQIISADSRQVYRGMDIGTAKVMAAERARVPHHGLDLVDPDAAFTVADYVRHADAALSQIAAAGDTAILVGGTGLYLRAVARGIPVTETGHDATYRAELERRLTGEGLPALVSDLRRTAPGVASRTDLANPRRVIRALERTSITGDASPPAPVGYPGPVLWLGLSVEPVAHRAAILARARQQFADGLIDEARALRERYGSHHRAFSAVGYHEAWAVLDGQMTIDAAIAADAQRNWAYARRQRTWFRSEPDIFPLVGGDATAEATVLVRERLATIKAPR